MSKVSKHFFDHQQNATGIEVPLANSRKPRLITVWKELETRAHGCLPSWGQLFLCTAGQHFLIWGWSIQAAHSTETTVLSSVVHQSATKTSSTVLTYSYSYWNFSTTRPSSAGIVKWRIPHQPLLFSWCRRTPVIASPSETLLIGVVPDKSTHRP